MPIVNYNNNPSLERIRIEGQEVLDIARAQKQDIRELHIGFLNMMPDGAFLATERQFFRLVASANRIVQLYIHPIKLGGMTRNSEIQNHVDQYYQDFATIRREGLDALIVTGANPSKSNICEETYWQHASEVFQWADTAVCSVFFSCLASHAILQSDFAISRQALPDKLWGIYRQRVADATHPLVSNINSCFDMPHSRLNDVSESDFIAHNLPILVKGTCEQCGVSLATSPDGFKKIFCQGHPEYDSLSILKELQREVLRFIHGERNDFPALPAHYLDTESKARFRELAEKINTNPHVWNIESLTAALSQLPVDNTWRDTAKAIFSNWIGLVYQLTHYDRTRQFMDDVDPQQPLAGFWQHQPR